MKPHWCFPFYSKQYKVTNPNKSDDCVNGIYLHSDKGSEFPVVSIEQLKSHWNITTMKEQFLQRLVNSNCSDYSLFIFHFLNEPEIKKGYCWALSKDSIITHHGKDWFWTFVDDEYQQLSVIEDSIIIIGVNDQMRQIDNQWMTHLNQMKQSDNQWIVQSKQMKSYQREYPYFPDKYAVKFFWKKKMDDYANINGIYSLKKSIAGQALDSLKNEWDRTKRSDPGMLMGTTSSNTWEWLEFSNVKQYDNGAAYPLYLTWNPSQKEYLWAVKMNDECMLVGKSPSSQSFYWSNTNQVDVVIVNAANANQQSAELMFKKSVEKGAMIRGVKRKQFPYYPAKYEVACISPEQPDPCTKIKGTFERVESLDDSKYQAKMSSGGTMQGWLTQRWELDVFRGNDIRRYQNNKGSILLITHNEKNKNYGYAVSHTSCSDPKSTDHKSGTAGSSDSFERERHGLYFVVNNAVSVTEYFQDMVKDMNNTVSVLELKENSVRKIKDMMLLITSSLLVLIGIIMFVKKICHCNDRGVEIPKGNNIHIPTCNGNNVRKYSTNKHCIANQIN